MMNKRNIRKITICLMFLSVFPAVPVFAGIEEIAVKGFNGILNSISTGIASWMFKFLKMFVLDATDISKVGRNVNFYLGYSQAFGIALVVYFTSQNLFVNLIKTGLGEKTPDPAQIIGRSVVNGIMVVSVHFLLDKMLQINNMIITDIIAIGINVDRFQSLLSAPASLLTSDAAVLFLILVVCTLVLAIMGGIRYAEIVFLYIIAPVLMAGNTTTNIMGQFFKTAIGIIFTQAVQVVGIGLLMSVIANYSGSDKLFITIGFLVLLMRGSKTLRDYLYSTGTGGAFGSAASAGAGMMGGFSSRMGSLKSLGAQAVGNISSGGGGSMSAPSTSPRLGSFKTR